ncbi:GL16820 [Drosophila persimilis]|uniref:GL16820 n=1 Tax=Drosophila persimilis TaxID=7234 RepID=B4GI57_DROPE|nr:GL16820 [Drosophila persimilis]
MLLDRSCIYDRVHRVLYLSALTCSIGRDSLWTQTAMARSFLLPRQQVPPSVARNDSCLPSDAYMHTTVYRERFPVHMSECAIDDDCRLQAPDRGLLLCTGPLQLPDSGLMYPKTDRIISQQNRSA